MIKYFHFSTDLFLTGLIWQKFEEETYSVHYCQKYLTQETIFGVSVSHSFPYKQYPMMWNDPIKVPLKVMPNIVLTSQKTF